MAVYLGLRWTISYLGRRYRPLGPHLVAVAVLLLLMIVVLLGPRVTSQDRTGWILMAALAGFLLADVLLAFARVHKQRRSVLAVFDWARSQGFAVESESRRLIAETLPEPLRRLPLFRRTCETATQYVLSREGPGDRRTLVFELETHPIYPGLRWAQTWDDAKWMTVIAIGNAEDGLPAFELRPATVAGRPLSDSPPWERIELTNRPRFAGVFTLYTQEPERLRRVLTSALVEELERDADWCLEGLSEWFIAYRVRRGRKPWQPGRGAFESFPAPGFLAARIKKAEHLCGLVTGESRRQGFSASVKLD
jgi:hypothetical protein